MSSYLELAPRDILEHIAFLVVEPSDPQVLIPLQGLLNLLLTSPTLYHSLCPSSAPHLYARIFCSTFDLDQNGIHGDAERITDSGLTVDLISRYRLLRRVRHCDLSTNMMLEDLCVAMRIVIQSAGVNESHLRSAGFSDFCFAYARHCLAKCQLGEERASMSTTETSLILWLLTLTWSRDDVSRLTQDTREQFLVLLRPLVLQNTQEHEVNEVVRATHSPTAEFDTSLPSACSAAIILYCALQEAGAPKSGPRILFGRIVNLGNDDREGSRMEDFCKMTNYQTPLFGDDFPGPGTRPRVLNSIRHDPQFFNAKLPGSNAYRCLPDVITGLWEGIYMVKLLVTLVPECTPDDLLVTQVSCAHINKEASTSPSTPDFICKKSLQCSLEFFFDLGKYDGPDLLVPESIRDAVSQWAVMPRDFSAEEDCLVIEGRKTPYEKFAINRDYSQALDCLVFGQTEQDHDRACGGFTFAGRMERDGTIGLKREPKNTSDADLGTWIFEGNIRYRSVFAGKWSSSPNGGIHGVFSLKKVPRCSQDEG
ncbi:hypothetical protein F5880DRAFT_809205 [Lentinula raphanica]|nr:hypothetical protein F5880DRAFT_809205 [Lentinula raphanica]